MITKIKLYARLIIEGVMSIEEVPIKYRMAVETAIEKIKNEVVV